MGHITERHNFDSILYHPTPNEQTLVGHSPMGQTHSKQTPIKPNNGQAPLKQTPIGKKPFVQTPNGRTSVGPSRT